MDLQNLTPEEKIQKAKIKVQMDSPFFGHLVLHLNYVETDSVPTLAVDPNGNMYYNPDYVENRSLSEMKALVVHEILHCGLEHFKRTGSRDKKLSNYAQDIVINDMLVENGFNLPDGVILPENNRIELPTPKGKIVVENIDEKNFEQVYEEVEQQAQDLDDDDGNGGNGGGQPNPKGNPAPKGTGKGGGGGGGNSQNQDPQQGGGGGSGNSEDGDEDSDGQGSGNSDYEDKLEEESQDQNVGGNGDDILPDREDVHMNDSPEDVDEVDQPDAKDQIEGDVNNDKDFEKIMDKAQQSAKQQGSMPAGMKRKIDEMKTADVNWKTVLQNYITNMLPYDYQMRKPNKKYRHLGIHMPSTKKESLDIVVAIDTSGSIRTHELEKFLGEVAGITKGFDNVNLTVVQHDAKVTAVDEVTGSRDIQDIEFKGGGGTDHRPVYKWIEENKRDAELVINFTDGYTSYPKQHDVKRNLDTIWVIDNYQIDTDRFDYGKIIRNVPEDGR